MHVLKMSVPIGEWVGEWRLGFCLCKVLFLRNLKRGC